MDVLAELSLDEVKTMGSDLVKYDDVNNVQLVLFGDYNPENTLLVFDHEDGIHFYKAQIKTRDVPVRDIKRGLINPLEYEVISHDIEWGHHVDLDVELSSRFKYDTTLSAMILNLKLPSRTLDYKLDLSVIIYVLNAMHTAHQNSSIAGLKPGLN